MFNVLIAGCGNFGAWWCVGLLRESNITSVTIYDPYIDNTNLVVSRAQTHFSLTASSVIPRIEYISDLKSIKQSYNLVVVGTNSNTRLQLFHQLLENTSSDYWILEKVLTSCPYELDIMNRLSIGRNVYVSHTHRLQPLWQNASIILNSLVSVDHIDQALGPWELASNSFHYVDLISWLFGTSVASASVIHGNWKPSEKRSSGFFDLEGSIKIQYHNSMTHTISRKLNSSTNIFRFNHAKSFHEKKEVLVLNEIDGTISPSDSRFFCSCPIYDWSTLVTSFTKPLIQEGRVVLPSISSVYNNTDILLRAFRAHWEDQFGNLDAFSIS